MAGVANALYFGRKDLVLLEIDPTLLAVPLRFEAPVDPVTGAADAANPERFPHIYGEIPLDAIVATTEIRPNPDGSFTFPF